MIIKKIPEEKMDKLKEALLVMKKWKLQERYRDEWTEERPTTGRCYIVAEVIYHYCAPEGSDTYRMETDNGSHWFVKTPNGEIIDPTADQFDESLDYTKARKQSLIPVPNAKMSEGARKLAELLGLPRL